MNHRPRFAFSLLVLACLPFLGCPLAGTGGHLPGESATFARIEFVWCPPGSFALGAGALEQESMADESPKHQVTFSQGFWISKNEITQKEWTDIMLSNPSFFQGPVVANVNTDNRPVESVSWNDVQAFLVALNTANPGLALRLPSEAEWEYACRAWTPTRFYWGEDLLYSRIGNFAWFEGNSDQTTHDVGQQFSNPWGLNDASGNVWEWVQDWYHSDYNGAPNDGSAWESPAGTERVFRGGSWSSGSSCRSAARERDLPDYRAGNVGFRIARFDS